jgi:N,N'-diacetyllegionaminate synthase|tara:strand:- start:178 stop:1191 length:1014 start_codon:yes stop_codon:yes gene_type:complete
MKKNFSLDSKEILFIAEIGGNHEGDFNYAKRLVRDAISSGVQVVKLQTYYADKLTNKLETPDRYNHFKKFELSIKQHKYLAQMCIDNDVYYNSSIWDEEAFKKLDKYLNFYKIGSGDLTALPLIQKFIDRQKPIILSTGLSDFKEIKNTVNFIKKNSFYKKKSNLALLQCTSCYPTIDEEVNLLAMNELKKICPIVGYSHHNKGDLAIKSAIALGAKIIEFHFTDTRKGKSFRDHKISLTKRETISLIDEAKRIKKFIRKDYSKPSINEVNSKHVISFRRGLFYKKNLKKGHLINQGDLIALRPNLGFDPRNYTKVLGKKLKISVKKLSRINYSDIE